MRKYSVAAVAMVVVAATVVSAGDWNMSGPRTLGMGGSGAASARGAWALSCNPAGLAEPDEASRISISAGADIRDLGLFDAVDSLSEYDWEEIQANPLGNIAAIGEIVGILNTMNQKALLVGAGGGAAAGIAGFGVGINGGVRVAFSPRLDLVNILPVASNASPNSFAFNTSRVAVAAMTMVEVPIGYGHKFEVGNGSMSVGGALKIMRGSTYSMSVYPTDANMDDYKDAIKDSEETSVGFGLDVGAIYHPPVAGLSLGFVARNLNSPKFDTKNGGEITEDAQFRVGAEMAFLKRALCVAIDADLNKRGTILEGYGPDNEQYKEQWVGGGISLEGSPWIFETALRLGAMKNLADSELGLVYTGGLSLGFKWIHISLSASMSKEQSEVQDATYPAGASAMLAIESTW